MARTRSLPPPTLPPISVQVDGLELPCWTYTQLDLLNRVNLKSRAVQLQTLLGPARCPPLLASSDRETLIAWILKTQCSAARAGGAMLSAADFGAPVHSRSAAPDPLLTEAELRRLEAAGIEAPAQFESRPSGWTAEAFPFSSQAAPRHPLALPQTSRNEFAYDERYTTVASEATSAAASNRARNRGSLKDVLFGEGEAPKAVAGYEIHPPFQTAPPGFEPQATSTTASAFKPPPSAAYRGRESPFL